MHYIYIQQARSTSICHHASVLPLLRLNEPEFPPPIGIKLTMVPACIGKKYGQKNLQQNQTYETFQF